MLKLGRYPPPKKIQSSHLNTDTEGAIQKVSMLQGVCIKQVEFRENLIGLSFVRDKASCP